MKVDIRPTILAPEDDPHIWLEDIEGKKPLEWVFKQNEITRKSFSDTVFEKDRDALISIYNHPGKIPHIIRREEYVYNFWKDDDHVRGIWRRTTLKDYASDAPEWEVLINIDELAEVEGKDWTWKGATLLPRSNDLSIIFLSLGGSDAACMREFDLNTKSFVAKGFTLSQAKGNAAWLDKDTLLLCSAYGGGKTTESGYSNTVRLWKRGEHVEQAKVIFEIHTKHMGTWVDVDRSIGEEHIIFLDRKGFFNEERWIGDRSGPKVKIDIPDDAQFGVNRGWLIVHPKKDWLVGQNLYEADSLLGISFESFLNGDRSFSVLFTPGDRKSLQSFLWSGHILILSILDNLAPTFELYSPGQDGWTSLPAPQFPNIGMANISRLDAEKCRANGDMIHQFESPLTPGCYKITSQDGSLNILKKSPELFDSTGLEMSRHEAVSTDGEKIPYLQIGNPESRGDAPVLMGGYGGFSLSMVPFYNATVGKLWLEKGGVVVTTNIRGGGEFGSDWHEAGKKAGKSLSHDDFAAIADNLVSRGVTTPNRIAAHGGSNGGLLVANMLTRYPERFGAIFCTIPLIDMYRYAKLLAGASWIEEYGDPEKPEDWEFLQKFSAYHLAAPNKKYPEVLIATTRKDDRVHPGHARKMAEKLQIMGYPAYYLELDAGGHSYGKDNREQAEFTALGFRFMRKAIGWDV